MLIFFTFVNAITPDPNWLGTLWATTAQLNQRVYIVYFSFWACLRWLTIHLNRFTINHLLFLYVFVQFCNHRYRKLLLKLHAKCTKVWHLAILLIVCHNGKVCQHSRPCVRLRALSLTDAAFRSRFSTLIPWFSSIATFSCGMLFTSFFGRLFVFTPRFLQRTACYGGWAVNLWLKALGVSLFLSCCDVGVHLGLLSVVSGRACVT